MPKGKKAHAKSGELEAFELFAARAVPDNST